MKRRGILKALAAAAAGVFGVFTLGAATDPVTAADTSDLVAGKLARAATEPPRLVPIFQHWVDAHGTEIWKKTWVPVTTDFSRVWDLERPPGPWGTTTPKMKAARP